MKKLIFLVQILIPTIYGCTLQDFDNETWRIEPNFGFVVGSVTFDHTGGLDSVIYYCNINNYEFHVSDKDSYLSPEWCSIEKGNEIPDLSFDFDEIGSKSFYLKIRAKPNLSLNKRQANITMSTLSGGDIQERTISIIQDRGVWDVIGNFSVCWSHSVSESQKTIIEKLLNNMVFVNGDSFTMGCQMSDPSSDNYCPYQVNTITPHKVILDDFYIGKFEISQEEWRAIMGNNPSHYKSPDYSIESISWEDAMQFCNALSCLTALNVSLPTDAQWEYAAQGGNNHNNFYFAGSNNSIDVAYTSASEDFSVGELKRGSKKTNSLGLYDMSGNVGEFCYDSFSNYWKDGDVNPVGSSSNKQRVVRGGSIESPITELIIYDREKILHTERSRYVGFRIVIKP